MGVLERIGQRVLPDLYPIHDREMIEPLEGTNASLLPSLEEFWAETFETSGRFITPSMAERVWVVNRCIQLNAQQIASMPLQFFGSEQPAWVSSPDPAWYPNGISDALFSAIRSIYGWGYALLFVTSRYSNGFPQSWTVADPESIEIGMKNGRRTYKIKDSRTALDSSSIVQIDRNPSNALHGTSAIRSYANQCWGLLAGSELARSTMQGGVPQAVLKAKRKINSAQAQRVQAQWISRVSSRGAAPPVLPPELDFETLSFSPKDLLLIDGLSFNARVIASAFGVPPFLLNLPLEGGLTYQNPAMLGEMWWRFELRPTAKRIADAITAQMLPRGSWVTFDAADTFLPLDAMSEEDDPQAAQPPNAAGASPTLNANAPVRPIRPVEAAI